jgi:hypothetical protein
LAVTTSEYASQCHRLCATCSLSQIAGQALVALD